MKIREIKLIQKYLREENLYTSNIDGQRKRLTNRAIYLALELREASIQENWKEWSDKRKAIAYLQLICQENSIDSGIIDGFYGEQTRVATLQILQFDRDGFLERGFEDISRVIVNPHNFPNESFETLSNYYGKPCEVKLVQVRCPWKLRLDWDLSTQTNIISIHEKLADSLVTVLENVYDIYTIDGIKKLGLDRYGGSFNCRKKRGSSSSWSTHSWGISVDWFPSKNTLSANSSEASLAKIELDPWWNEWEKEGWLSLGRQENRDWMHVQAAKR